MLQELPCQDPPGQGHLLEAVHTLSADRDSACQQPLLEPAQQVKLLAALVVLEGGRLGPLLEQLSLGFQEQLWLAPQLERPDPDPQLERLPSADPRTGWPLAAPPSFRGFLL